MRENIVSVDEIREIVLADAVLIVAFSFTRIGGIVEFFRNPFALLAVLPIMAIGVTFSFILHELMHKFTAQHYGAIAGFKTSQTGLWITLITGMAGFLLGIPGATMIYVHSFTRKENGIVSLAGPLTNFAIFGICMVAFAVLSPPQGSFIAQAISFTIYINLFLAFFNMLPITPLDGSKVLAWDKNVYIATEGALFLLIWYFQVLPLGSMLFLLIMAYLLSSFYRHIL